MARKHALPADTIQAIEVLLGIVPSTGRSDDGTFSMTVPPRSNQLPLMGDPAKFAPIKKLVKVLELASKNSTEDRTAPY